MLVLVRWTIASFFPVMSSIVMFCHAVGEAVSPAHPIWQLVPSLKTSLGPGSLGATIAWESRALDARTVVTTMEVNMTLRRLGRERENEGQNWHDKRYVFGFKEREGIARI